MTFLYLCQRLRQEAGAAGTGPASVDGQSGEHRRLIDWVRSAWRDIQTERERWRFAWAEASVEVEPAFREHSLPDDFGEWDDATLRLGDTALTVLPWAVFRERFRDPQGALRYVSIAPDDMLHLNAAPGQAGTITFEYWRTPQELVEASDVPRLPARFHMVIVYRALLHYGLYENAPEVVQAARVGESRLLTQMEGAELPLMTLGGPLV